jgi:hypothetical protein
MPLDADTGLKDHDNILKNIFHANVVANRGCVEHGRDDESVERSL